MPATRSRVREVEVAPLHGGDLERLEDVGVQRQQAPADRVAHRVGQHPRAVPGRPVDPPLGDQESHDLVGVERVALGQRAQGADELLGGLGAAAVHDQRAQILVLEAREVQAPAEARQLAEDRLDLGPRRGPAS